MKHLPEVSFPSSSSSAEVGCSLRLTSELMLLFYMPHAAENHPLSGWISATLWGIPDVGQKTGHSTSTSSPWYVRARDEASSGHMLRPLSASPPARCPLMTQQTLPNQAHLWDWFPRDVFGAYLCRVVLCPLPAFTGWLRSSMLNSMHWCSLKVITSRTHQSPILEARRGAAIVRFIIDRPPPPPPAAPRLDVKSLPTSLSQTFLKEEDLGLKDLERITRREIAAVHAHTRRLHPNEPRVGLQKIPDA